MTVENQNPETKRAEAYLEILKLAAEKKGFYSNNWSVIKFPEHSLEAELVVCKEKPDGEILIYAIPQNFEAAPTEASNP